MKKGHRVSRQRFCDPVSRRDFLKGAAALGVGTGLAGLPLRGARAAAAKEVNIGVLYPTSGSQAQFGQMCVNAIKLAVDDINSAGGIKSLGGAKINADLRRHPERHRRDPQPVASASWPRGTWRPPRAAT